jgi:V8-like Glu-specific endopeptidase
MAAATLFLLRPSLANDDFADRRRLSGDSGQVYARSYDATREPGEPVHVGLPNAGHSLWWSWVPPVSGAVVLFTWGSDFDTTLAVYTGGSLGSLTDVTSNDDRESGDTTSLVVFRAEEGTEYQIAVEDYWSRGGRLVLTWLLLTSTDPPENDAFEGRALIEGPSGRVVSANLLASEETGEPDHAGNPGGRSLWWKWVAPDSGILSLDSVGSNVATLLAVYEGGSIDRLSSVTSASAGDAARILQVEAGREYQIAIDGADASGGILVLRWLFAPRCGLELEAPASPLPSDGATGVDTDVSLRWGDGSFQVRGVIYGADDRREVYEVSSAAQLRAWHATGVLVPRTSLQDNGDGTVTILDSTTYGADYSLCFGEPFWAQPNPGFCSGSLVAPDLFATAGHCLPSDSGTCESTAIVFGYRMLDSHHVMNVVPSSQVFYCDGTVGRVFEGDRDWQLLRLDRPADFHCPLEVRRSGRVPDAASIVVMGHPSGLPAKVAAGGRIRDNSPGPYFVTNLDTYQANSGSAVLDTESLQVEGVLVQGDQDFVQNGDCQVSKVCAEDACRGEDVTRVTEFSDLIPEAAEPVAYDVFFGRAGDLRLLGRVEDTTVALDNLEPGTAYSWQVVAVGESESTAGPVWSFTTAAAAGSLVSAGDAWRYLKGTREPSPDPLGGAPTLAWTGIDFDDSGWLTGPTGIGYGDGDDATVLGDMQQAGGQPGYLSVYARKAFHVDDPSSVGSLTFRIDFDDGFVAYLNGVEIAGSGLAGEPPAFDERSELREAGAFEEIVLGRGEDLLVPGENVLAVQGHNAALDSSDFSLIPELIADGVPAGVGPFQRGDCNQDGIATGNVTDVVFLLNFLFQGGRRPPCLAACNFNGADDAVPGSATDTIYFLNFSFNGGPPMPDPLGFCGLSSRPGDAAAGCGSPDPAVCPE